jgi:hypothetical protein
MSNRTATVTRNTKETQISLALGLAIFVLLLRPVRAGHRVILVTLGVLWIWIAWAFFWERYASINWASAYVAPMFGLQGVLFLGSPWWVDRLCLSQADQSPT